MTKALLILTCVASVVLAALGQIKLYSHPGCKGFFITIPPKQGIIGLVQHDFDDTARSVRGGENWIYFDSRGADGSAGVETVNPDEIVNGCYTFKTLPGKISAVLVSGPLDNTGLLLPGLSLYQQPNFSGAIQHFRVSESNIRATVSAIVLTGAQPWTIYGQPGFAGPALCIHPNDKTGKISTFFPDTSKMETPIPNDFIKSAKQGCDF